MKTFLLLVLMNFVLNGCYQPNENMPVLPKKDDLKTISMCDSIPSNVSLYNSLRIDDQINKRYNLLSGKAEIFQNISTFDKIDHNYSGLWSSCDFSYEEVNLECNGEITIKFSNGNIEKPDINTFFIDNVIFSKKITLCGLLTVNENQTIFIRADEINFKDFSVVLKEASLISISAGTANNYEEFRSVTKSRNSVFSINLE